MAACFWQLRRLQQPFYRLGFGLDWLALGVGVSLVVSSVGATFPLLALQNGLMVICYGILLYGLRNTRWSPQQLCEGLVWVGAIAAIISLALWRPTPDMWLSDNFYDAIRNRFPLGHHNFTGGYFVLVMPVACGLARLHQAWRRWLYGLLGIVIAMALYASGSRGAWLGGLILITITLVCSIARSRGKTRLVAMSISSVALCLVLILAGSNPRIRSLVVDFHPQNLTNLETSTGILNDGPTVDRIFMAQATANVIKHRPLIGLGPGNLGRLYERYRPLATGNGLSQVQQVHNTPLQLMVELGVLGVLGYLALGLCIARLTIVSYRSGTLSSPRDQRLSVTIAMGFLGYGISSLSDYQLENIPIAATLTILLAALTKLGGASSTTQFSRGIRRWSSVLILMVVALVAQFWLRSDLALWITHQGLTSINQGNLIQSDNKFYTAAALTPWDPTPSALGAQQLTEITPTANDENQKILRQEALDLYRRALQAAPNDIWFNQNLAVLAWQTGDVQTAHRAIAKVVQLSPRSKNHSYYLLGLTEQALGNIDGAIEAWALECLINPQAILFTNWDQELGPFREAIFAQVAQHYQTILEKLTPDHPIHTSLENQIRTLGWWSEQLSTSDLSSDRPLLQALFVSEENKDRAGALLDQCIADIPEDITACRLIKAWLTPKTLDSYLSTVNLDLAEQTVLQDHIKEHRNLKTWMRSTTQPINSSQRVALALLYRNYYAQRITSILLPENLYQFSLPVSLRLFTLAWPREFTPLDTLIENIRANSLGLPHPTHNNFQLTDPQTDQTPSKTS
ncbi:O-antigen ligase family protein [Leptothoe kymatousa]|uniref:O-antigen ligase family protein n=1 Tax=Leptothoe kymatousa TAU-MAC 1615 TaxID=2364775 RepID=A0ABS5Y0K8_9CYAN|nr:O-antigen ligase family protein [Leptothoe kymatousa]MBT9311362.1 O-antigen ligase family protein [Leptothoe kymatousa TAU-MAC 1615]